MCPLETKNSISLMHLKEDLTFLIVPLKEEKLEIDTKNKMYDLICEVKKNKF